MMRLRLPLLACCLMAVAASVASVPTAFAADPDPAPVDVTQARNHFERGRRYFQVDEFQKAIEEFKAAHVEKPDPAYLYNIAECHRRLGETKDALVFYRRFLSLSPPNNPARPTARKRIAELEAQHDAAPTGAEAPPTVLMPIEAVPGPAAPAVTAPPAFVDPPAVAVSPGPADTGPAPGASKPLYKRPWFLAVVGAVVVAGAVGVWALSTRGGTDVPSTPLGNQPIF
jgi:tetratricopeptide (TPR) repeat protein